MDFLEFLKSACYYSAVKFDMQDNKIYKWQAGEYTGFSFYRLNNYLIRIDYCGSDTGYTLQHYTSDYNIYKGGSYTNYDLRECGYGVLRLYRGGSLYGEADYRKEKEEAREEQKSNARETRVSSSGEDEYFPDGFWSWKSWGKAWVWVILLSCILLPFGPVFFIFMIVWAILLVIHNR